MKGLVLKDLLLMLRMDKKIVLIMYILVAAMAFLGESHVYAIASSAFFSFFIGMHLMITMTYDGMSSWKQYELTLPMNNYQIIAGKYLTCLCLTPISVFGTAIIYIVRYVVYHNFSFVLFIFSAVVAMIVPVLWCSICFPLAQWFGYMNVQYVRMAGLLLVAFFMNKMPENTVFVVMKFIQHPMLIVLVLAGVVGVSYFASVIGYSRKN